MLTEHRPAADQTDDAVMTTIKARISNLTVKIGDLEKEDPVPVGKVEELQLERDAIREALKALARGES